MDVVIHQKIDHAKHTLCASVTEKFLKFSLSKGNDLKTPRLEFNFRFNP